MKRTGLAALVFAGAFAAAGTSLGAASMTLKGTVTDKMCGANHHGQDAAECTMACVGKGSDYALVDESGKVYTLKVDAAQKAELNKLAGKMAEVMGDVTGETVMVKSVKMGMVKK